MIRPTRRRSDVLLAVVIGLLFVAIVACVPLLYAFGAFHPPADLENKPAAYHHEVEPPDNDPELATLLRLAYFRDVTAATGIDFTCRNGEEADHKTLLESLGGGVALIDFDRDGELDVFLVGGGDFVGPDQRIIRGRPGRFYRNLGDWRFRDMTSAVGLGDAQFYSHGAAVADYDRDGWPDLLVSGYGGLALYHNEPAADSGRRFVDVSAAARLIDSRWNTSAAWADLDGDGYPDLYVCHYVDWSWETHKTCAGDSPDVRADVCPPGYFRGTPHAVYRNNGNGTFTDVSGPAGLKPGPVGAGMGLGVVVVDVNADGKPDVYAVNDTTMNFLYVNRSKPGEIRFDDVGLVAGVAMPDRGRPDGSMGVDAADYDGSGRPALWVTTFEQERHALYRNEGLPGRLLFRYVTRETGVAALGSGYVGFGTAFIDVDNDGLEDLVVANGHVRRSPTRSPVRQRAVLLMNRGDGRFAHRSVQGGEYFRGPRRGRGLAAGDLDDDGKPDLIINHQNEPAAVLRNDPEGEVVPRHHWVGIELIGKKHRDVVGATVVVEAGGRKLTRFAKGGGSYLSSGDRRIIVGLGSAERADRVTVRWPWGEEQNWEGLAGGRYWKLDEGETDGR